MFTNKWLKRFFIYPCLVLIANLAEEIASYYTKHIDDPHLRTIAIIFFIVVGFGVIFWLLEIILPKTLQKAHRTSKKAGGLAGELLILAGILGGLYWAYYQVINYGVSRILP